MLVIQSYRVLTMSEVTGIVVKLEGERVESTCHVQPKLMHDRGFDSVTDVRLNIYIALVGFPDHDSCVVGNGQTL